MSTLRTISEREPNRSLNPFKQVKKNEFDTNTLVRADLS